MVHGIVAVPPGSLNQPRSLAVLPGMALVEVGGENAVLEILLPPGPP